MSRFSNPAYNQAPPELSPNIREIDYLCYARDEVGDKFDSTFESSFVPSCIEQLRKGKEKLSDKQHWSLRKLIQKYKLHAHVSGGYLTHGYADVDSKASGYAATNRSTKMAQANDEEDDDDFPV